MPSGGGVLAEHDDLIGVRDRIRRGALVVDRDRPDNALVVQDRLSDDSSKSGPLQEDRAGPCFWKTLADWKESWDESFGATGMTADF